MWFLRRIIRISWTAKKSNETVLQEADTKSLITPSNFFLTCDAKREIRISCDNWNDRRKTA